MAIHVTVVSPTGKDVLFSGVHAVVTGVFPFVAVGAPYVALIGDPSSDCSVSDSGQEIDGGSVTGGGVGLDGEQALEVREQIARPVTMAPVRIFEQRGRSTVRYRPTLTCARLEGQAGTRCLKLAADAELQPARIDAWYLRGCVFADAAVTIAHVGHPAAGQVRMRTDTERHEEFAVAP